jgi:DNA replication and repair protein RecF
LDVFDNQLVEVGVKLTSERDRFVKELSDKSDLILNRFTDGLEKLRIEYKPSATSEELAQRLQKNRDRDIYYGTTGYGIHKDDIIFYINGINARDYASQGQQRSIIYSLKLAEVDVIRERTGNNPVLLLDDVLSELDKNRQKFVINSIDNIQTIITCTGVDELLLKICESSSVFNVKNGQVKVV